MYAKGLKEKDDWMPVTFLLMMMMKSSCMTHNAFAFSPPVKMQPWPLLYVGRGIYIYHKTKTTVLHFFMALNCH